MMTQQLEKRRMLIPAALWDVPHSLFVSAWFKKSSEERVCGRGRVCLTLDECQFFPAAGACFCAAPVLYFI